MNLVNFFFKGDVLGNATAAVTPRLVGGTYRIMDSYDPRLREKGASPAPHMVIKREAISVLLGFVASFATGKMVMPMTRKLGIKRVPALIMTALVGNIIAEAIARRFAYKCLDNVQAPIPPSQPGHTATRGPQVPPLQTAKPFAKQSPVQPSAPQQGPIWNPRVVGNLLMGYQWMPVFQPLPFASRQNGYTAYAGKNPAVTVATPFRIG